jgi:hypothetical protein
MSLSNHLFFKVNCLKDKLGSLGNNQNAHKLDARCRLKIKVSTTTPSMPENINKSKLNCSLLILIKKKLSEK